MTVVIVNPYESRDGTSRHAVVGSVREYAMAMAYRAYLDAHLAAGTYPTLFMHEAYDALAESEGDAWVARAEARIAAETARPPRPDRILAAASLHEGEVVAFPSPGRHHDTFRKVLERWPDAERPVCPPDCTGFVTEEGRYVGREEAARLALSSGQVSTVAIPGKLFSEDLW